MVDRPFQAVRGLNIEQPLCTLSHLLSQYFVISCRYRLAGRDRRRSQRWRIDSVLYHNTRWHPTDYQLSEMEILHTRRRDKQREMTDAMTGTGVRSPSRPEYIDNCAN
jgi:hypothetical protein